MKSMQRKFGGFMKRSADDADIGAVLADFKAADEALDKLIKDFKQWREQWDSILRYQSDCADAFLTLYKSIGPMDDAGLRHQPTETPQRYMSKALELQSLYSDTRTDLAQEIRMIDTKLLVPLEAAKMATKSLHKTTKHRENMKLDYERYSSRVEHARKKENRSLKEEAALAKHESDLTQAKIDYQTADDQVRQTFPPVTRAIFDLMAPLLANQVMIQTTLVGQLYTVLEAYCRQQGLPSPAPSDVEILAVWESEFTGFRKELESELRTIASGAAVRRGMALQEKDTSTVSGLGIRNKVFNRNRPEPSAPAQRPAFKSTLNAPEAIEAPPPKPPRPGQTPYPTGNDSLALPSPHISMAHKPRAPSTSSSYSGAPSLHSYTAQSPPTYDQATPPSRYATPVNGGTPTAFSVASGAGRDYFGQRSPSQSSITSAASSLAAAKKKPPPPVPVKRIPSSQGQYVTAVYDFDGQSEGDLAFREGDRILVVKKTNSTDDWWTGSLRGVTGSFPANYVEL